MPWYVESQESKRDPKSRVGGHTITSRDVNYLYYLYILSGYKILIEFATTVCDHAWLLGECNHCLERILALCGNVPDIEKRTW